MDRYVSPMQQSGPHWGAIAFTLSAGLVMVAISSVAIRDALEASTLAKAEPPVASATVTPAATQAPAVPVTQVAPPAPEDVAAALLEAPDAPVIFRGRTTTLTYLFRNAGSAAWVKGSAAEARLGIVGDDTKLSDLGMAVGWLLPTRPAVQLAELVEPGGSAQFSFQVKGTEPGRYRLAVAVVIDGVAWTDAAAPLDITVR